jgi:elongation factor 3
MTHKGKTAVVEDAFADGKLTPARSRVQTPAGSAAVTPAGSGAEDSKPGSGTSTPAFKKKKMTRNQMKAQEERRRLRKLAWLTHGGPKPEDTDSD